MSKVDLRTLESVTGNDAAATALLNANFEEISEALDNAISRDGTAPNYMDANLDMNNKRLINLADPENDYDAINKKYFTDTIGNAASYASQAATSAAAAASSAQSSAVSAAQAIAELQAAEATINAAVQQAVNTASGQAAADIANYVNTVVEPNLQNIANMAQGYSNNSSNYANLAMAWASQPSGTVDGYEYSAKYYAGVSSDFANSSSSYSNNSSNYANSSYNSSANSSNYANSSLSYSNNSSNYANNAATWAEGTDEQVQALGGIHSSKIWSTFGKFYVGQIVESPLPLIDATVHLLDGSLILGGGIYDDFVQYIAELYAEDPTANYWTTEAAWQQSVTDYGVCGKFVYDSVNNTVRLPKYSDKIYTTDTAATAPVAGNGKALGLYNGSDTKMMTQTGNGSGNLNATRGLGVGTSTTVEDAGAGDSSYDAGDDSKAIGVSPDENKSGLIAKLSNITAPVEGYYYIVVAISTKTDIEVDIDEVTTDLNGKVGIDLSNMNASQSAKSEIVSWLGLDSNSAVTVTTTNAATYTCPADGCLYLFCYGGSGTAYLSYSSSLATYRTNAYTCLALASSAGTQSGFYPVRKGEILTCTYSTGTTREAWFVPYIGG